MADLAFLWHMHQPDYRHPETREFLLPWVLLHGIKDYSDMAAHLERHPAIRCTVNFVPILLEQIEDYVDQFASGRWRDRLLAMAASDQPDAFSEKQRRWLLDIGFRCHAPTMLEPFAGYRRLRELRNRATDDNAFRYLSGEYYTDLATWTLLAWTGESLRRDDETIAALLEKGAFFTLDERLRLLAILGEVIAGIIPRYRALADNGQIELSCTPSHHPLAPLLLDFSSAHEAWPDCPLPSAPAYPGGEERVKFHLADAATSHRRRFGRPPAGLWPAEGAVSAHFLSHVAASGFTWTASSLSVLRHSVGHEASAYRPWRAPDSDLTVFFRDEKLSDLIGFVYSRWHGQHAATHLIGEIAAIAARHEHPLIPVFLDGENAWETFPYNAWYFFDELYATLAASPAIRTVTLSEATERHAERRLPLPRLVAGSWVYGSFSTWIGNSDKNHAWDLLCQAKTVADRALADGTLSAERRAQVLAQLAVCESSDWFWWFGTDNPAESVSSFDRLFRANLQALYRLLELPVPSELEQVISHGGGHAEVGGTMRRSTDFPG